MSDHDNDENDDDDELPNDPLANLDPPVLDRIHRLQELHEAQQRILYTDYLRDRAALEDEYNRRLDTFYQQRLLIVSGQDSILSQERQEGIPQFWLSVLTRHNVTAQAIEEDDLECLTYLTNISCDTRIDGFALTFDFEENPYFANPQLVKDYTVPNLWLPHEPLLQSVQGCTIDWHTNNLTMHTVTKKQKGKGKNAGQWRTISRQEPKPSFFTWFRPPVMPSTMTVEQAQALESQMEEDYALATAIRDDIVPSAVAWFAGKGETQDLERVLERMQLKEEEDDDDDVCVEGEEVKAEEDEDMAMGEPM